MTHPNGLIKPGFYKEPHIFGIFWEKVKILINLIHCKCERFQNLKRNISKRNNLRQGLFQIGRISLKNKNHPGPAFMVEFSDSYKKWCNENGQTTSVKRKFDIWGMVCMLLGCLEIYNQVKYLIGKKSRPKLKKNWLRTKFSAEDFISGKKNKILCFLLLFLASD